MKSIDRFKIISGILVILYGGIHLWNSAAALSIQKRTEIFGWNQNFGLYAAEKDNRGLLFRWTKKSAGISVETVGPILVIPVVASHPNIEKDPVKVKVYLSDPYFKRDKLIKEMVLKENKWIEFEYPVPESEKDKIYIFFQTSRTWQPLKYLNIPDPRKLAIGLGKEFFKYPDRIPAERIKSIKKIPRANWEGKQKDKLWTNGIGSIKFSTAEPNISLLLNVEAQTALGLGPYIIVRIDEQIIGKCMLNQEGWNSLVFIQKLSEGEHELSVEFINDFFDLKNGMDRNVYLGDLEIIYLK